MSKRKLFPLWRKLRAAWRDTWILFREFRWPLLIFFGAIFSGGMLYFTFAQYTNEPIRSPVEATYHVLGLTFLQPIEDFPHAWFLQIFYFLMPVIGIGILAQGVADFGVLLFNRRERGVEWEMALASTFNKHVILVGLGHLGFRVARHLRDLNQDVVVVELDPSSDLVVSAQNMDIPVIADDATREAALLGAGIKQARTLVLCTQNDSLNLQIALKARRFNPNIRVVIRIFDDEFAQALQTNFGFRAFSSTGTAAPVFASAAAGVDMTRPITVEGEPLSLAQMGISSQSKLVDLSVERIEADYNVSVVLLRHDEDPPDFHPPPNIILAVGDTIAVLGGTTEISRLSQDNNLSG